MEKADAQLGQGIEKSKGHVAFAGNVEYYLADNGDLYQSVLSNVISLETGNRIGRFEAKATQANARIAQLGLEPVANLEPIKAKHNPKDSRIPRFRKYADTLQKQIDNNRNPAIGKQNITARRARIASNMSQEADRLEHIQMALLGIADAIDRGELPESLVNVKTKAVVDDLVSLGRYYPSQRLSKAGIDNESKWQQARADLQIFLRKPSPEDRSQQKIKEMERSLIGKKLFGFFPTPTAVINKMLDVADIKPGMSVLEPSAGKGDIADAIKAVEPSSDLSVVEISHQLRDILQAKGYTIAASNFLSYSGSHDRILMNPPFERGQDIEHVQHAYKQLKPGGRLVAIMSEGAFFRTDKKATGFRKWIEEVNGEHEKLPARAFSTKAFRATSVATQLVTINKPFSPQLLRKARYKPLKTSKKGTGK